MSETTAMRMGWTWARIARIATIAAVAALWILAALYLWRIDVPHLHMTGLDEHRYFSGQELSKAESYSRFTRWDWLAATLVSLAALATIAWRAPKIVRSIGIGRIGKGVIAGTVTIVGVWFATVPFTVAEWWWERRHGLVKGNIFDWFGPQLPTLAGGAVFEALAILIVMGLAGRFQRRWWVLAAPSFTALALLFTFISPYLTLGTHRIHDPRLRAEAPGLARRAGAPGVSVRVEDVSNFTTQANAESVGLGPSRQVIVWNTILRKPFTYSEDAIVLAHEFTHQTRNHLWKGVAWFGLLALPGTFLIALITRRRGGVAQPETIPLALLVIAVLQLVSLPFTNAVSRRYESEADWGALRTTHDPAAARSLFRKLSTTSLQEPDPSFWDYALLEDHPTVAQRIQMTNQWAAGKR
jgi:STE24 endopeptidase